MKLPERVSVAEGVVSQVLGEEVVLLHLHTGVYWNLNASGAVIWNEVQSHGSARKASEALCSVYLTSKKEADEAVSGLLQDLAREGLVQITP